MALTDAQRLQLFDHYKTHLGEDVAGALMTTIPPFDWHEIATKTDLAQLQTAVDRRFEQVDRRFDELEQRFDLKFAAIDRRFDELEQRFDLKLSAGLASVNLTVKDAIITQTKWMITSMVAAVGVVAALANFF